MAEGVEEAESNSGGDATAMLGAAMPCETMSPNIGNLKREFEAYHSSVAAPISAPTTPIPQGQPINLKSEEFEKERESPSACSPLPSNINDRGNLSMDLLSNSTMMGAADRVSPHEQHAKSVAAVAAAQAHINGTMQGMLNLQKLQNLASIQQSSMPSLAGLQGLAGLSSAAINLNSPLNLSVGSATNLPTSFQGSVTSGTAGVGGGVGSLGTSNGSSTAQMPQLILASGQLVQGVQGAQLLIPTSQGITTQTILTIPVSQQINSNEQLVQTLAALNNGAASLSNMQMQQSLQQQQNGNALISPNLFPNSIQQLLAAVQSQSFSQHQERQQQQQQQQNQQSDAQQQENQSSNVAQVQQSLHMNQQHRDHHNQQSHHLHHHNLSNRDRDRDRDRDREQQHTPQQSISPYNNQQQQQTQHPVRHSSPPLRIRVQSPKHSPPRNSSTSSTISSHFEKYDKQNIPTSTSISQSQTQSNNYAPHTTNGHVSIPPTPHHGCNRVQSPNSVAINSISRLTSTNGELTITKSHGPPASHSSSSTSTNSNHHTINQHSSSSMKMSPSSLRCVSPAGTDNSTTDLLSDSPDEPTINQTNCNVVDGIDLDEIKEFAKAFKLRRLSLGLTQTQVGQALSVTEGPAYSQSAICSALAAQMYAAQLSSQQQQNMFEKLDITPKSAQKIKPVLERWMKEAEESHWNRYKSGQNHLTDFIGVEPSKKRKRRTSFTPQALELLNAHFERNTHPSGTEITGLAHQLGYEREVIRIWFCNKRQALKNTVRMMSKGMV